MEKLFGKKAKKFAKRCWLLCALFSPACSSTPTDHYSFDTIVSNPVRVRRPIGEGANPKAGPGGIDYQSTPRPNAQFDCVSPEEILRGKLNYTAIRSCFASLSKSSGEASSYKALYRLIRKTQPELVLDDPEDAPECLRTQLNSIPIPREFFFIARREDKKECFATRIDIDADRVLDIKLPVKKYGLAVAFPMDFVPQNDAETERLLTAWMLTPFFGEDQKIMGAKLLPEDLCKVCYRDRNVLIDPPNRPSVPTWPVETAISEPKTAENPPPTPSIEPPEMQEF